MRVRLRYHIVAVIVIVVCGTADSASRRLDVGGHSLRLRVSGKGSPVVVFESGLGDPSETWDWIRPEVSRFTRAVAYDRAGLGKSQAGPAPRDSDNAVEELRRLLSAAEIDGPYLLVGHSLGGLHVRLFASRYPEEVVGLVLLDPTPVEFPSREPALRSAESQARIDTLLAGADAAVRDEWAAASDSAEQVRQAALPEGLPVIVLSSPRVDEGEAFRDEWARMQRRLAERVGAVRHETLAGSGHYIQYDQPDRVVHAIRELSGAVGQD